jgi:hypothetical protein
MPTPPIPDHWSAEQALAMYEFLDPLLQGIWDRYGPQIQEQLQADPVQEPAPDLVDPNDPIPF